MALTGRRNRHIHQRQYVAVCVALCVALCVAVCVAALTKTSKRTRRSKTVRFCWYDMSKVSTISICFATFRGELTFQRFFHSLFLYSECAHSNALQHTAPTAMHCNTLRPQQCTATHCKALDRVLCLHTTPTPTHTNALQHPNTPCNTLHQIYQRVVFRAAPQRRSKEDIACVCQQFRVVAVCYSVLQKI